MVETLDQAALKAFFSPGEERIDALVKWLACERHSIKDDKIYFAVSELAYFYVPINRKLVIN